MAANRQRRWLSFTLRGLMLAITALAVWLGLQVNGALDQQAAVTVMRQYDPLANIWYDNQTFETSYSPGGGGSGGGSGFRYTGWTPAWIEKRLGKDYFHSIESVSFGDGAQAPLSPEDEAELFRRISRLGRLKQLVLNFAVCDANVADIAKLPRLTRLEFSKACPQLTDEAMRTLSGMSGLESLTIRDAPITDAGLAHLAKMPRLKSLALGKVAAISRAKNSFQVTDRGLRQLAALNRLEELELNLPAMTGGGLEHLAALKTLKWLQLDSAGVADDDLRTLIALTNLSRFEFVGTETDDRGFRSMHGLQWLKALCLEGANVGE
jgi:hypothetical protein